jgi:predicted metal-binding membrane protein
VRVAVDGRRPFAVALVGLVALAWLALWMWGNSPYSRLLSHDAAAAAGGGPVLALAFVAGWTLMIVAMMLPSSLPLVLMFATLTRRRQDQRTLVGLLLLGYLATWSVFGAVVHAGDLGLHAAVNQLAWLSSHAWLISAVTLMGAGVYQFSSLKYRCLEKCRSPFGFITEHWRGHGERGHAFVLGVHHGLFCVGCCWLLMLLMFAVGVGSLGWMLTVGAVMALEKNVPWGRRLSSPLGVVLVGSGVLIAVWATVGLPSLAL